MRLAHMRSPDLHGLESQTAVSLSRALREANALIPLPPGTRREVISAFLAGVAYPEPVDPAVLAARVLEREELSSTATVDGVAFLHTARWESRLPVHAPLAALGRLPTPIDFGAVDRTPTDLLFLLLAPDDRTHLTLLAKAARLCRDPELLSGLRGAGSGREVRRLIEAAERAVFTLDSDAER